ncbi:MAG TPA: hypothetical protein V6C86_10875 [Oculatellaceae cyanobacterium]
MSTPNLSGNQGVKLRSPDGAVLAEGVVALWMVTVGVVCGVILLVNAGMYTFYKEKISYIGNQAATMAAALPVGSDSRNKTLQLVKDMLNTMNLPNDDVEVSITSIRLADKPGVSVEVKVNNLPLIGNGQICPIKIGLNEKSAALCKGASSADAYLLLRNRVTGGYIVPLIRMPANGQSGLDAPLIPQ